jgi:UDP-N-acetylglucosamine 2-epimerase (non-hydrolysing)
MPGGESQEEAVSQHPVAPTGCGYLSEGIRPQMVIKTGSPRKQVFAAQSAKIAASRILDELQLAPRQFFLASAHRDEDVDDPARLQQLVTALAAVSQRFNLPVIVSTHPRTQKRLGTLDSTRVHGSVRFTSAMAFADYVQLQTTARCVLSDSGTLTEEASILGFPAVMLRNDHERPEGMDEGTVFMSGIAAQDVVDAVATTLDRQANGGKQPRLPADYDVDDVAWKVVNAIQSYPRYVDRVVWHKPGGDGMAPPRPRPPGAGPPGLDVEGRPGASEASACPRTADGG